uniref:Uncharacterized protein n=1 Tax=Anguilla anguilla TaxID=7936 RepID=A0A0E9SNC9_ANGAN
MSSVHLVLHMYTFSELHSYFTGRLHSGNTLITSATSTR